MTTPDDLVERVARAMYERWRATRPNAPIFDNLYLFARESELADARAAIRIALEEAAKVAETAPYDKGGIVCGCSEGLANWTATAIRGMIKD
jgi:hypothetical protein